MLTLSLLIILSVAYIVLKVSNVRAEFARKDAELARAEQAAREAMEEEAEEAEIRAAAVDVDAETIDNEELEDTVFDVEPASEGSEEDAVVIEVPEYDTVR